jgi:hypothetical protein
LPSCGAVLGEVERDDVTFATALYQPLRRDSVTPPLFLPSHHHPPSSLHHAQVRSGPPHRQPAYPFNIAQHGCSAGQPDQRYVTFPNVRNLPDLRTLHRPPCHREVRQHANLISLMPDCCLTGNTSTRRGGSLHVRRTSTLPYPHTDLMLKVFFFSIPFLSSLVPPTCAYVVLNMRIQYFFISLA